MSERRLLVLSAAVLSCAALLSAAQAKPAGQPVREPASDVAAKPAGYLVEPVPGWVVPAAETAAPAVERAPWHYRLIDEQVRIDGRAQESYQRMVRVVNDAAGLAAAQIEIPFDPSFQTLALHHVDVLRDGRRATRLDRRKVQLLQRETQLERRMIDGRLTASLVLDDVRAGDQIDYAYTVRGANPVFGGRYVASTGMASDAAPVLLYQRRLLAPVARRIAWRPVPPDVTTTSRVDGAWRETVLRRQSVSAWRPEPGASVQAALNEALMASEFADWSEVAAWGRALFAETGRSPGVDEKAAELRARYPDPAARLLAALEFVQKDVRYFGTEVGLNSHRPAVPEQVLQQRFGDCKDKVALLLALLRRMDIAGEPVLVSTPLRGRVAQALPSPLVFDHVIARVVLDGRTYWLDATRSHQSGPLAARQPVGLGQGLVLGADTTAPVALPTAYGEQRMRVEDRFVVDDFAAAPTLESRITLRGEMAEVVRDRLANAGTAVLQKEWAETYLRFYPKAKSMQAMVVEPVPDDDAITLVQRFSVPEFWRRGDQGVLVGEAGTWSLFQALRVPDAETRRDAFAIAVPGIYTHRVSVQYPEAVLPRPATEDFDEGDEHFSLRVRAETTPRSVEITGQAVLKVDEVAPQAWPAYTAHVRKTVPHLGASLMVPPVPLAKLEQLKADLKSLENALRSGRVKPVTNVQTQAHLQVLLLDHQIAGGRLAGPLLAQALTERGVHNDHLGRLEAAGLDFERALELTPDARKTLGAAATNAMLRGRAERALALTDAMLRQRPDDDNALATRSLVRYLAGDYAAARDDTDQLLKNASAWRRGYPLVMWSLMQQRTGGDVSRPDRLSRESDLPTDWPRPLVDWALGKGDAGDVLRAARSGSTPAERLCEAYFYLGEQAHAQGDTARAAEYFRKAVDQGVTEFTEDSLARLRLAALQPR